MERALEAARTQGGSASPLKHFLPASGVNAKMRAFVRHTPTQKEEKTDGS
jgi:hypothetical protein